MRIRTAAAAAAFALAASGCGSNETCPSESPEVQAVANCTAAPGSVVNYQLRLCPTCNQNLTGCTVDMQAANAGGGTIFLNPVVESCGSSASCGAATCLANPTCSVTVPAGASNGTTWAVQVFDPAINATRSGTLTAGGPASCSI